MELEGLVYKSTGSWYVVQDKEGNFWNTRIKGKMKLDEDISSTNPIAVGDNVIFDEEDTSIKTGIIKGVKDRRNYIVRISPHNKNQKHIIAANIDQALIIVTVDSPRTSTGFIDRFLLTAEAYYIPAVIAINKIDILKPKNKDILDHWVDMYGRAGYPVYPVIATVPSTIATLAEALQGKMTLFSGHSGVGKSTLINQLIPGIDLRTYKVSGWSGKGQHTTTFAEMFDLPGGGRIIDTPGVKEFGLIDFEKHDLAHYYPEMRRLMNKCKFNNCVHINEPDCAITEAVRAGIIPVDRYLGYRGIMDSIEDKY